MTKNPKPYKLKWLDEPGEVNVNRRVLVNLSIGRYNDKVVYDVVPMHAGHILLGRSWQFDQKVKHDGFRNRFSFVKDGIPITLVPLTPQQAREDQIRLRSSDERKTKERQKESLRENGEGLRVKKTIRDTEKKERESDGGREKYKASSYAIKGEVESESELVRANKPLPSLYNSLWQDYETLLHEDFDKGVSLFEYLVDPIAMEQL
ncbi:uncharacterized protein LOC111374242 [Olea europaea var. sylvestris]|uniref:uncharacterized protein LOC111374242 n=1 Tax=Olea europaea var. sylvestris TaxID=158386 RepID=UPI000C1D3E31|nr:uncharacterized protein LOC111374242 [Olea europaea var. sylvestris]